MKKVIAAAALSLALLAATGSPASADPRGVTVSVCWGPLCLPDIVIEGDEPEPDPEPDCDKTKQCPTKDVVARSGADKRMRR